MASRAEGREATVDKGDARRDLWEITTLVLPCVSDQRMTICCDYMPTLINVALLRLS